MSKNVDGTFQKVELPEPVFDPPFNITRASHITLGVSDLPTSLKFYEGVMGMLVTEQSDEVAYLRGAEEACHHSLILKQNETGVASFCESVGFRVLVDDELDKAYNWAKKKKIKSKWIEKLHQSRTLRIFDPVGTPVDFCAHMPVVERAMGQTNGGMAFAKRLDHFQILCPDVAKCTEFYVSLGFRVSDVIVIDGSLEAVFLWRKGSVSDLVLMHGPGPRVHHAAYLTRQPDEILRACDMVGELGFPPMTTEEGPGRHGMDGAYYIYFRDPDGHRVELFDGHYQTIDAELEPKQFPPELAAPPWGRPTLASWFKEGTAFSNVDIIQPDHPRFAPTMEDYVLSKSKS